MLCKGRNGSTRGWKNSCLYENICIFKGVINGVEKETSVVNFIEDKKDCKKNGYLFLFDNEEVFVNWGNPGEHNIIDDSFDMYAGRKIKPKFNKK